MLPLNTGASQVVLMVKKAPANAGDVRDAGFDTWVGKILWRRARRVTHSSIFA